MARNLANHNTIHRLQTNKRDGKPIQQAKPQIGQATKKRNKPRKKTDTHHQGTQFHTRTVNLTNIRFSQEEISLLNNVRQHSIEKPLKKYWTNLIMETEQAIRKPDSKMQAPYRILATKKLRQLNASNHHKNVMAKRQTYNLKKYK